MGEHTKRGQEDEQQKDQQVNGEPVGRAADDPATLAANTTRDKGMEPAMDARREGRGVEDDEIIR